MTFSFEPHLELISLAEMARFCVMAVLKIPPRPPRLARMAGVVPGGLAWRAGRPPFLKRGVEEQGRYDFPLNPSGFMECNPKVHVIGGYTPSR